VAASADRPLKGRVILVTRPAGRGQELARLLREDGARVEQRPTIDLVPPHDPAPSANAISRLSEFDWILFTSSNGVRFFFDRLAALGTGPLAPGARMAAIGPATARELECRGFPPALVPTESRAEGLGEAMRDRARSGERVLLVRPEEARPVLARQLEDLGLRVEAVPFYRNVPAVDVERVARDVMAGRYDAVVFTAPSTLRRLLEGVGERQGELRQALAAIALVAIGEVTAGAIERHSFAVAAVAAEPSDRGVADALRRLFHD
jgi:uroporphyrinogen-III synthase